MNNWVIGLATVLHLLSALLCYLAAARQQLLARPLPAYPSRGLAALLMLLTVLLWRTQAQLATALFAVLTLSMVWFALLPYVAAWRTLGKAR